jgi:hypothetical protein
MMKTGERERRSEAQAWCEDGYRVIARRPRSEICTESIDPERADEIEAITHGMMPLDQFAGQVGRRRRATRRGSERRRKNCCNARVTIGSGQAFDSNSIMSFQ